MWQHIMIKEEIMDVVVVEAVDEVAVEEVVVEDTLSLGPHMPYSKGAEVNFAYEHKDDDNPDGPEDHNNTTHLDVSDFLNMDCLKIDDEDICLVDSGSTHTVLKKKRYFSHLTTQKANISTILGVVNIIEGFGKSHISVRTDTILRLWMNENMNTSSLQI
ncbi:hypothetical protein OSB04_012187 [Centaurea solstitialis]|uniref:Uncharacterized protein n=1 Tax=Centaurea solstitialis TaxID=347529 RepID=A0AA38TVN9_9ASTR|nr:hypothetical protein OSB04_012187 [Centaurea solstitialis]